MIKKQSVKLPEPHVRVFAHTVHMHLYAQSHVHITGELSQFSPSMFLNQQLRAPSDIGAPGVSLRFRKSVGKIEFEGCIELKESCPGFYKGWNTSYPCAVEISFYAIFVLTFYKHGKATIVS